MPRHLLETLRLRARSAESVDLSDWEITNPDILAMRYEDLGRLLESSRAGIFSQSDSFLTPDQVAEIKIRELMSGRRVQRLVDDLNGNTKALDAIDNAAGALEWYHNSGGRDGTIGPHLLAHVNGSWDFQLAKIHAANQVIKTVMDNFTCSKASATTGISHDTWTEVSTGFAPLTDEWAALGHHVEYKYSGSATATKDGELFSAGCTVHVRVNLTFQIRKYYTFDGKYDEIAAGSGTPYHMYGQIDAAFPREVSSR